MSEIRRRIGLSLGADLCWPVFFEEIFRRLAPAIEWGGNSVHIDVERVAIRPFDLKEPSRYDVVLDRLTHWYAHSREWIKKAIVMDDVYVLNNPWALQSMEKQTCYCAMMELGLRVPETWLVPPREYEPSADLQPTLDQYAEPFDLSEIGRALGYPLFMKPYDGGAWVGVHRIASEDALHAAYAASGKRVMHLQKAVPYDLFVRCVGVGPQLRMVRYNPDAALHERYEVAFEFLTPEEAKEMADLTLTINSFFGWDFNSCEALRSNGCFYPIDFANACPDSQVTSLHFHMPWLVKALLRWTIYCAATDRPMRKTLDWAPYEAIARQDMPYREKLAAYAAIARDRLDEVPFNDFCEAHLSNLDEIAWEFFGTDRAKDVVRSKVHSLFPAHEVDEFTEHFWGMLQFWRKTEADQLGLPSGASM